MHAQVGHNVPKLRQYVRVRPSSWELGVITYRAHQTKRGLRFKSLQAQSLNCLWVHPSTPQTFFIIIYAITKPWEEREGRKEGEHQQVEQVGYSHTHELLASCCTFFRASLLFAGVEED
jgi:hypothetical protein